MKNLEKTPNQEMKINQINPEDVKFNMENYEHKELTEEEKKEYIKLNKRFETLGERSFKYIGSGASMPHVRSESLKYGIPVISADQIIQSVDPKFISKVVSITIVTETEHKTEYITLYPYSDKYADGGLPLLEVVEFDRNNEGNNKGLWNKEYYLLSINDYKEKLDEIEGIINREGEVIKTKRY